MRPAVHVWRIWGLCLVGLCPAELLLGAGSKPNLKDYYRFACAACHGEDGWAKDIGNLKLPGRALADPKWISKQENETLTISLLEGKGAMPSFKGKLTAEDAHRMVIDVIRPLSKKRK